METDNAYSLDFQAVAPHNLSVHIIRGFSDGQVDAICTSQLAKLPQDYTSKAANPNECTMRFESMLASMYKFFALM